MRVQFEREPYAPMGAPRRRGESQGRHRGAPSFALFLIIGAYGAVFGFLHVVPLALSLDVSSRVTAFLFGAVAALGLFSATLRQSDGTDVVRLWNRFYQYVFPIVTVAALLGPLTMDTEFLPLLILQACALYYFDVLLYHCSCHQSLSDASVRPRVSRQVSGILSGVLSGIRCA